MNIIFISTNYNHVTLKHVKQQKKKKKTKQKTPKISWYVKIKIFLHDIYKN